jgi:hypothetical protein
MLSECEIEQFQAGGYPADRVQSLNRSITPSFRPQKGSPTGQPSVVGWVISLVLTATFIAFIYTQRSTERETPP